MDGLSLCLGHHYTKGVFLWGGVSQLYGGEVLLETSIPWVDPGSSVSISLRGRENRSSSLPTSANAFEGEAVSVLNLPL